MSKYIKDAENEIKYFKDKIVDKDQSATKKNSGILRDLFDKKIIKKDEVYYNFSLLISLALWFKSASSI